jgi:hypothetical protein
LFLEFELSKTLYFGVEGVSGISSSPRATAGGAGRR